MARSLLVVFACGLAASAVSARFVQDVEVDIARLRRMSPSDLGFFSPEKLQQAYALALKSNSLGAPERSILKQRLGDVAFVRRRFDSAASEYEAAAKEDPQNIEALAWHYYARSKYEDVSTWEAPLRALARRGAAQVPTRLLANALLRHGKDAKELVAAMADDHDGLSYFARAAQALVEKRFRDAVEIAGLGIVEAGFTDDPELSLYILRSQAYEGLGDIPKAWHSARDGLLQADCEMELYVRHLFRLAQIQDDVAYLIGLTEVAGGSSPASWEAALIIDAVMALRSDDLNLAVQRLNALIEPEAKAGQIMVMMLALAGNDLPMARTHAEKLVKKLPKDPEALLCWALYSAMDETQANWGEAVRRFEEVARPSHPKALVAILKAYAELRRANAAAAAARLSGVNIEHYPCLRNVVTTLREGQCRPRELVLAVLSVIDLVGVRYPAME